MIRLLKPEDYNQIKQIHEKYYNHEFSIEEFNKNYLAMFVVVEDDIIITAGGVRTIAEVVIVTNKDFSVRIRRDALYNILEASAFITKQNNYDELHAFVQDDIWGSQLRKVGFRSTRGKPLVIGV